MLFKAGLGFKEQFEGSSQAAIATEREYAFAPDELQIGSIVFGRLKRAIPNYAKACDDRRPMLVTGLWRSGDSIEKLELMPFSTKHSDEFPSDLMADTTQIFSSGQQEVSYLKTHCSYILDNSTRIFPFADNKEIMHMNGELWEDIFVRRANAIIFNTATVTLGRADLSLRREGFVFPTIPQSAVRSNVFIPEVDHENFSNVTFDTVPQELIDEIVSFAVRYNDKMIRINGHAYYTFPSYEDWPVDLPKAGFPVWRNPFIKRGLEPELP